FFQAENGIRDRNVTGVQTCALPISMQWFTFGIMSFVVWGWLAFQKAVRNREDKLRGEREEDGFISARRIERAKPVKRRKGRMTEIGRASCRERARSTVVDPSMSRRG